MQPGREYVYDNAHPSHASRYLWPEVRRQILAAGAGKPVARVLDVGCGNGAASAMIAGLGIAVTGVDTSGSGIEIARSAHPGCRFEVASAYEDLAARFGTFTVVVSLEVIEHLYDPRQFARRIFDALEPGGVAMLSTPYHGYLKNLALAVSGRLEGHFTALWDGGHIKFFSMATLAQLLTEAGFEAPRFVRVGRIPPLAKSMIAITRKPRRAS